MKTVSDDAFEKVQHMGKLSISLHRENRPQPKPDPGYDLPRTVFVVAVWSSYMVVSRQTFSDHAAALVMFEDEVRYHATQIAKEALRVAA